MKNKNNLIHEEDSINLSQIGVSEEDMQKDLDYFKSINSIPSKETVKYLRNNGYDLCTILEHKAQCLYCNGRGYIKREDSECPYCHIKKKTILDTEYWNFQKEGLAIPPQYQIRWDYDSQFNMINNSRKILADAILKNTCINTLNTMHDFIVELEPLHCKQCLYIYLQSSNELGSTLWIYNLLQMYAALRYKVSNLVTLSNLYLEGDNYNILKDEVLFITVTPIDRKYNVLKLDSITYLRQQKGLTTIVLSPVKFTAFPMLSGESLTIVPDIDLSLF